jgi:hypothetical protein
MENIKVAKRFRMRYSVLLLAFWLAVYILIILSLFTGLPSSLVWVLIIALPVIFIYLYGKTEHIISNGRLYMKIWDTDRGSMEISDIVSIELTYNMKTVSRGTTSNNFAFSLRKLKVSYLDYINKEKTWVIFISPVREQEFLDELKAVNPNIDIRVPAVKKSIWRIRDMGI